MKWYSPIFTMLVVLAIILLVGLGFYENKKLDFWEPAPQTVRPITPMQSSSSIPAYSPSVPTPTATIENPSRPVELSEWKTYTDEEYKFQIQSPEVFSQGRFTDCALSDRPLRKVHFTTIRFIDPETITIAFTVCIHTKPSSTQLVQWLSEGYKIILTQVQKGNMDTALERAYTGKSGVISYQELRKDNMSIYEVGEVWGGYLQYAAYLTNASSPYIYEIGVLLPFRKDDGSAEPSDRTIINLFNQIVEIFKVSK